MANDTNSLTVSDAKTIKIIIRESATSFCAEIRVSQFDFCENIVVFQLLLEKSTPNSW